MRSLKPGWEVETEIQNIRKAQHTVAGLKKKRMQRKHAESWDQEKKSLVNDQQGEGHPSPTTTPKSYK